MNSSFLVAVSFAASLAGGTAFASPKAAKKSKEQSAPIANYWDANAWEANGAAEFWSKTDSTPRSSKIAAQPRKGAASPKSAKEPISHRQTETR